MTVSVFHRSPDKVVSGLRNQLIYDDITAIKYLVPGVPAATTRKVPPRCDAAHTNLPGKRVATAASEYQTNTPSTVIPAQQFTFADFRSTPGKSTASAPTDGSTPS